MKCCGHRKVLDRTVFVPDYRGKPLTEKFYARHEALNFDGTRTSDERICSNVARYKKEILKRLKYDPRNNSLAPVTENQVYGWIEKFAIHYEDEIDRDLMLYPKKCDGIMRTLQKISYDMKRERDFNASIKK